MSKLKRCPHCGEIPELREIYDEDDRVIGYTIFNSKRYNDESKPLCYGCSNCDEAFGSKEETIKAWNTRFDDWISVDKALPEDDEEVLVLNETSIGDKVCKEVGVAFRQEQQWHNAYPLIDGYEIEDAITNITHWKPIVLPE